MPPKASRGRGATRARGASRGGATAAARSAAGTNDATPQSTDATAAIEAPAASVITKQEDGEDTKVPVIGENLSGAVEPQVVSADASYAIPSTASCGAMLTWKPSDLPNPSNDVESSSRPPVQRIGGLQGSVPPSRSASPSARGRGSVTRGKRGMVKPTFTGRRTKEEREALAKELKEREELRNAERNAAEEKKRRDQKFRDRREQNKQQRARGGYHAAVSGPFSLGSSKEDRKNNSNRGPLGYGGGSGSRAVRVKNEGDGYGGSGSGSRSGGGGGGPSVKREDGGYVSSDEEDGDAEFPRRDIDLIEISSDENEDEGAAAPSKRLTRTTLPVRIGRKEHQERTVGINTDASSETAAKILEKTESKGELSTEAVSESAPRKGKAKEVEITGERKPFRGVWQDIDDSKVAVKTETISDDEAMAESEPAGLSEQAPRPTEESVTASPNAERRSKIRTKSIAEPILQTDEDRAEWARFQSNLQSVRAELGPEETPAVDENGDTEMADGAVKAKKPTVRDNNVYLFQVPPLMPELLPPSFKLESTDEPSSTAIVAPPAPAPAPAPASGKSGTKIGTKIKLEEGSFSDPSAKAHDGPRFASGLVGKLRVRASGRTTLDWGGTSYELTPGNKASFLQEVVSIHAVSPVDRVVPEEAGDAISMGRVKGKFVVVPDWENMLG
ncbi:hypothetical protein IAQ61_005636 [Plenodomus lingam]|uniref:uncharacterized protein n=1 Tax=Leptosphaeria maculans TaxID=5022 RepID=UPI003323257F|nr:hypothetical protein IAQ61_005636 [Plenodomus lingam]